MKSTLLKSVLVAGILASAGYAVAAGPKDVVAARVKSMKQIGRAHKILQDELKKSDPSLVVVRENARTLAALGLASRNGSHAAAARSQA